MTMTKEQAVLLKSIEGTLNQETRKQLRDTFPELFTINGDTMTGYVSALEICIDQGFDAHTYRWEGPKTTPYVHIKNGWRLGGGTNDPRTVLSTDRSKQLTALAKLSVMADLANGDWVFPYDDNKAVGYTVSYNPNQGLYVSEWRERHVGVVYFKEDRHAKRNLEHNRDLWNDLLVIKKRKP